MCGLESRSMKMELANLDSGNITVLRIDFADVQGRQVYLNGSFAALLGRERALELSETNSSQED
jgi:hypothetical protein